MRKNLKLKQFSLWFSLAIILTLVANTAFLLMIQSAYDRVINLQAHRQSAMALANELRQETEQLTYFVRAYTSTGKTRYLTYYYDILAIRQGEKPLPENYIPSNYWDMAVADEIQHQFPQNGERYSLAERMVSLKFDQVEFDALDKILLATEAMKHIEQIAFAATQGLYDPKKKDFVSDGKPHLDFASKLVHSQKYNVLKSNLSKSVTQLIALVDMRTNVAIAQAAKELERWIFFTFGMMIFTFFMVIKASQMINRRILKPIDILSKAAARLAQGDYSTRTSLISTKKQDVAELEALDAVFNSMAESIEQDIMTRQKIQKELEQANQKAEAATHAKSMFLANMSHEIRTPMNAIIGMAYLTLKTELTPQQKNYITEVQNAAKSLLGIINDILDFSKVEAGKIALEQTPFVLEEVVVNSLSLLRQRAWENEIELLLDISDPQLLGKSGTFLGDALRLNQIFTNLLSNALKFTPQGYVKLTVTTVERRHDEVLLRFQVRDTGIGMSSQQINNLFQEFTQADGSTTRQYGGTGLGLTITKRFIELMKGNIRVESMLDEGSNFIFTAPFLIAKPVSPALTIPKVDRLRVLVLDDQPEAGLALIDLLTALGVGSSHQHEVTGVANGKEALAVLEQAVKDNKPYDVLLLDWLMPEMDGGAVLQALQKINIPSHHQPQKVVISSYHSDVIHEEASCYGVHYFLFKPILPEALRELFNSLVGNTVTRHTSIDNNKMRADLSAMRVLLVEDNLINQQVAIELMTIRGIEVTVANNGQEALDRLASVAADYYHLVLMDLQMPVMDGYEATRRLRADPRYFALPVCAMTAHAMTEEREICHALGMDRHLSKPIEPDQFYSTLAYYCPNVPLTVSSNQSNEIILSDSYAEPLPNLPGLDTANGIRRAGGNQKLYRQLLASFTNDLVSCGDTFANYIANAQWQELMWLAHILKGLAGTLGVNDLVIPAGLLETAGKYQQTNRAIAALADMTTLLEPLIPALQHCFANEKMAVAESTELTVPADKLPHCLPQLLAFLSEGDSEAIEVWETHYQEFSRILSSQLLDRISVALRDFEFDVAYTQLAVVSEQLKKLPACVPKLMHNLGKGDSDTLKLWQNGNEGLASIPACKDLELIPNKFCWMDCPVDKPKNNEKL